MNLITRIILFLFLCITSRILISYLSIKIQNNYLLWIYFIFIFIIGISFLYLYFTNSRLNALEGGGKTWWSNFRIVHGINYILASSFILLYLLKYLNKSYRYYSFYILLSDTIFGLILFILHHTGIVNK